MNDLIKYKKQYDQYLIEFEDMKDRKVISKNSKPLSFENFIPDSYK